MQDYDIIMKYKNLKSMTRICKENKVDTANLVSNRVSQEKMKKVADIIKDELTKLVYEIFIKKDDENV